MKLIRSSVAAAILSMALVSFSSCGGNGPENPGGNGGENDFLAELSAPADPKPQSVDFDRKVLLLDFTGTACQYCPNMMGLVKSLLSNSVYKKRVVPVIVHSYDPGHNNFPDPAFYDAEPLYRQFDVKAYPTVVIDMVSTFVDYATGTSQLQMQVDNCYGNAPVCGLAANSLVKDGKLYIRAAIKPKTASQKFRIGAMVVEDGLYAKQNGTTDESYYTHNDCLRYLDGKVTSTNFSGHALDGGDAAVPVERQFAIPLSSSWKQENCRYVVYVTVPDGSGGYQVNAVGSAKFGKSIDYLYK